LPWSSAAFAGSRAMILVSGRARRITCPAPVSVRLKDLECCEPGERVLLGHEAPSGDRHAARCLAIPPASQHLGRGSRAAAAPAQATRQASVCAASRREEHHGADRPRE
jgi:hypothetical protein